MNRGLEANGIKPLIDTVIPFEWAVDAWRLQAPGNFVGKIAITLALALLSARPVSAAEKSRDKPQSGRRGDRFLTCVDRVEPVYGDGSIPSHRQRHE